MVSALTPLLISRIREHGPITVAELMDVALYHPAHGYYARAAQRSGREGDFFTSVDVGPLFGEMIALQIEEMWRTVWLPPSGGSTFDLVEAAAGNGRLTRDVLDAALAERMAFPAHARVTLVERSAAARAAQARTFHDFAGPAVTAAECLPAHITGVIFANELLDAMPVHVVETTASGLEEIYVGADGNELIETRGPLSDVAIAEYVGRMNVAIEPGTRLEVGLEAVRWIGEAAAALDRGFLLLFDYGHEARELFSPAHAGGTLTTYRRHSVGGAHWLSDPGDADLTSHVNITALRQAAESSGCETLAVIDQTYFMTGLGIAERLPAGTDTASIRRRLAASTLLMPGGLGSTMKVMAFAKNVGRPALGGLSSGRLT